MSSDSSNNLLDSGLGLYPLSRACNLDDNNHASRSREEGEQSWASLQEGMVLSGCSLSPSQACILDGNKYASRCREEGEQSWSILRDCMVLRNQRREPLLTSATAQTGDGDSPQVGTAPEHRSERLRSCCCSHLI